MPESTLILRRGGAGSPRRAWKDGILAGVDAPVPVSKTPEDKNVKLMLTLVAAVATLIAGVLPASAAVIYATGQNNGDPSHGSGLFYYSIDALTGVATRISPVLSGGLPAALAGTRDGRLLGIQSGQLAEIDPFTGLRTNIGSPAALTTTALDVLADGRGYVTPFESGFGMFTQTQNLYRVDLSTGQYTAVTSGRTVGDAIDAVAGQPSGTSEPFIISLGSVGTRLFGVDLDSYSLIEFNPDTGAASVLGAVGAVQPAGLPVYTGFAALTGVDTNGDRAYDALYGNVNFIDVDGPGGSPSQRFGGVIRYDLVNGVWSLVGSNPGLIFFGFASPIPVPEPASLAVLSLGLILLVGGQAIRRRRPGLPL